MADKKIRVGIIGTGGIANAHMDQYKKFDDVEIVCGADIVPGKAKAFFERWEVNAKAYEDHKEMLENEELDVVSVCTYNRTHAVCTIDALEHGLDVLLEKPMCVTMDEAVEMMRAEKKTRHFISVGFQPRFDNNMKMIKRLCEDGALGEIYYIQTGGGRRRGIPGGTFIMDETAGIGALGDIGCYSLDMVLNAIGYPKPLTVSGYTSDFFGKNPKYFGAADRFSVDDFAAAFVRLEGGVILDFRISWAMHANTPGDTIIFGKDGALRIPSTDCWNGSVGGPMTLYHDLGGHCTETVVPLLSSDVNCFYHKVRSFLDAHLAGDNKAPVPTSQIIINQAIIDGIGKSAKLGREIEIELPEI
jgi:predicted dehydrogenase